ncbi:MAG: hypothetical protein CMM25_04750 [Rhodospirillaceae bacterium]|nr:hypothetical protein [Rhodospirillaceae bacterium]
MSSVHSFIGTMRQFLDELLEVFPEIKKVHECKAKFILLEVSSPRTIVDTFMKNVTPFKELVQKRDDKLFSDNKCKFLKDINATSFWNDELSPNTKKAIWDYMNTLYMMGITIQNLPEDLLETMETFAEKMSKTLEDNPEALNNMLTGLLGNVSNPQLKNSLGDMSKLLMK